MADIILHRRSFDTGSVPTTHSLGVAQFAINVPDGKVFIHKSSSVSESIVSVVTTDSITTGSITLTETASAGLFVGAFSGSMVGNITNADTSSTALRLDVQVQNKTGASIAKGKVVRISGSVGDNPLVTTASYTDDANSANTLGITLGAIATDGSGSVITNGVLTGINTAGMTAGQLLYLGPTGSIITTVPVAPLHSVRLGEVLRVHASQGSMYVRVDNGAEIGELHDVIDSTTTASFGDLLVKSGSVWINSKNLTGSYNLTGSLTVSNSLFVNGTQTVTGSVTITGSLNVFTSLTGSSEFEVVSTGVRFGNVLTDSHGITGSVHLTGSLTLSSSVIRLHQSASVSGTNIFGTASWADNTFTASYVELQYGRELHVSVGGSDSTGDGTFLKPFRTIGKALHSASSAIQIVVHPGTYSENPTVSGSASNVTITATNNEIGGIVEISGSLTVNQYTAATKIAGLAINNLIHTGSQNLYLQNVTIRSGVSKTGNGYLEATNLLCQGSGGFTVTGPGIVVVQSSLVDGVVVNNASATVNLLNNIAVTAPSCSSGILSIDGGTIYSQHVNSGSVFSGVGAVVALSNLLCLTPTNTSASIRLNAASAYSIQNVTYNKSSSILGVSLNNRAQFQHIQADAFSGSLSGSVNNAETASFANSGFTINSSSLFSFARTSSAVGLNSFSISTGSTRGSVLHYTVTSQSNGRTGQVLTSWVGSNIVFAETHTPDIGNTSGVSFTASLQSSHSVYTFGTVTPGWNIEFLVTQI